MEGWDHFSASLPRSPCIVIAYLMKARGWRLLESYKWVKEKRASVQLTSGGWNKCISWNSYQALQGGRDYCCLKYIMSNLLSTVKSEDQKRLVDFEMQLYNSCSVPNGFESIETTGTGVRQSFRPRYGYRYFTMARVFLKFAIFILQECLSESPHIWIVRV